MREVPRDFKGQPRTAGQRTNGSTTGRQGSFLTTFGNRTTFGKKGCGSSDSDPAAPTAVGDSEGRPRCRGSSFRSSPVSRRGLVLFPPTGSIVPVSDPHRKDLDSPLTDLVPLPVWSSPTSLRHRTHRDTSSTDGGHSQTSLPLSLRPLTGSESPVSRRGRGWTR